MNLPKRTSLSLWLVASALSATCALASAQPVTPASKTPPQSAPAATAPASTPAAKASPAKPKSAAEDPDTLILSDTLNYDDVKKQSVFTGNVIMTRGLMTLRSDTLTMHEDADGFQFGTATVGPGKLVVVRQETPEKFEVIEAKGLRAEYNGKTDEIEMIGQAVVTKFICGKPFDNIHGERIKYNQATSIYQAFSTADASSRGTRVRSVTTPSAKADAAAAACKQKQTKG